MDFGFLTLDILIIVVLFIGTFIYSFNAGKKAVVKLILAVYPAVLIFKSLPFDLSDSMMIIGAFVILYIIFYFLLKRNFTAPSEYSGGKKFLDSLLISIASVFTLLIIYYKLLPIDEYYALKLPFSGLLIEKLPFYLTLLIPVILISITNKGDK